MIKTHQDLKRWQRGRWEPSSPCAQLEHLPDLLRNRVNIQQNPSLYEVWRPKIVEGIDKQMVKRLHCDAKVPGISTGIQVAVALGLCLPQDTWRRVRSPAPSPTRTGRAAQHQEGLGCWKSLGGIEMKCETHRGGTRPLGLWTLTPEKLRCQVTPGEGKSWAVLVPDLDSLQTGWKVVLCETTGTFKKDGQLLCKELSSSWRALRVISAAGSWRLSGRVWNLWNRAAQLVSCCAQLRG